MFSTIARDIETQTLLQIGDIERRSGLYVLGKPGMGKTALLTNLILEDIAHGHGVFFLDPHGNAILHIINRLPGSRNLTDVILLDPTHPTHTFGINPLRCSDITDIRHINSTYARAYGIFERIWRDDFGPWLQLILSNTLSVFIENQGYTLADVPLFFDDEDFRNFLVRNVRHNTTAANYWRRTFAKQREGPASQNRCGADKATHPSYERLRAGSGRTTRNNT